jgi:hypothetical protein
MNARRRQFAVPFVQWPMERESRRTAICPMVAVDFVIHC